MGNETWKSQNYNQLKKLYSKFKLLFEIMVITWRVNIVFIRTFEQYFLNTFKKNL